MSCWRCGRMVIPLSDAWVHCQNCTTEPVVPRSPSPQDQAEAAVDGFYGRRFTAKQAEAAAKALSALG